jgi:hypothetical protein
LSNKRLNLNNYLNLSSSSIKLDNYFDRCGWDTKRAATWEIKAIQIIKHGVPGWACQNRGHKDMIFEFGQKVVGQGRE